MISQGGALGKRRVLAWITLVVSLVSSALSAQGKSLSSADGAGQLDPTFGDGGIARVQLPTGHVPTAMAIQENGKIVLVGTGFTEEAGVTHFRVVRLRPDGALDPSFSGDGLRKITLSKTGNHADGVAIQPDGKIVVVGLASKSGNALVAIARLNRKGTLDSTFSGDGKKKILWFPIPWDSAAVDVAIQSNGKIVVAIWVDSADSGMDFGAIRLKPGGALDKDFGDGGNVNSDFPPDPEGTDVAYAMGLQENGKIVLAGRADPVPGFGLLRYRKSGALDSSFGGDGFAAAEFGEIGDQKAYDVTVQPNGKIVAAGDAYGGIEHYDFGIARFLPNGGLDPTFGDEGRVTHGFIPSPAEDASGSTDEARGVVLQDDGKIVVGGLTGHSSTEGGFALIRLRPGGALDTSFGDGGTVTTAVDGPSISAADLGLQEDEGDEKVLLLGQTWGTEFLVLRYLT